MNKKTSILFCCLMTCTIAVVSQEKWDYPTVDQQSYQYYQKGNWTSLIVYGEKALRKGQDFLLLRLRLGYARYMTANYSAAIVQYEAVLKNDSYNATAHYYILLCRKMLNQSELGAYEAPLLPQASREYEKLEEQALTGGGAELSYKATDHPFRGNPFYLRFDLTHRLKWNLHMQHALGTYQQTMNEPLFTDIQNSNQIKIGQLEYYNKTTLNLTRKIQLKGAYHYLNTPFNNLSYNSHLGMLAVKYYGNFYDLQASAIAGKSIDSNLLQTDLQLGYCPFGNNSFYGISTLMQRNGKINFRQVVGLQLKEGYWLEANHVVGSFSNVVENDALYLYNSIDPNLSKTGLSAYALMKGNLLFSVGYTYEKKSLYKRKTEYNQHSITAGLSWKL